MTEQIVTPKALSQPDPAATLAPPPTQSAPERKSLEGLTPESWLCVDCGVNTAPGMSTRVEFEAAIAALGDAWHNGAGVEQQITSQSEVYTVRDKVWQAAGMESWGGCLCIGCLEKRLGRRLRPKDFKHGHAFNLPHIPGTARLLKRRGVPRLRV